MLLKTLPTLALLAPTTLACAGHTIAARNASNSTHSQPNPMQLGPDTPSAPETTGYFVNHLSLNVVNLTASMEFYTSVFGMRHVFTYRATEHLSFTYLSHSQGGRNGSAYQTTAEILRLKNNNAGHIELMHLDVPRSDTPVDKPGPKPESKRGNKMNHIGIIVPDLEAAQKRLEEFGVTIHKKIGEAVPEDGYLGDKYWLGDAAENLSDEEFEEIREGMRLFNWWTVFASDPDGNLLEILPLNEASFV